MIFEHDPNLSHEQYLVAYGQRLRDHRILADYGIQKGDSLDLLVPQYGEGGGLAFADVSNSSSMEQIQFSSAAPRCTTAHSS